MTLIDLKKSIESGIVETDFMIFVCPENTFIADQYIDAICDLNNLTKTSINSLQEQTSALSLVFENKDELNVMKVDTFDEALIDYSSLTNTIVVCSKVDKKIKQFVEDYIIEFPKLVDWQIKSYINLICPQLDNEEVDWLCKATNNDIYRIVNEIDKIRLFPIMEQKGILNEIRFGKGSDLYALTIFELADAIVKNNKAVLLEFLRHDELNFEPMSIVGMTLKKVKDILFVTQNSNRKPEDIGLTSKQAWAIDKSYKGFPLTRLQYLLKFLSDIDLRLKSGELDMPKNTLINYLIINTIL